MKWINENLAELSMIALLALVGLYLNGWFL